MMSGDDKNGVTTHFIRRSIEYKIKRPVSKENYDIKMEIINIFRKNIKNAPIEYGDHDEKHCGKEGHWLEKKMGILHNSKNEPDFKGYEMKKRSSKVTLGDFSASEYIFTEVSKRVEINRLNEWDEKMIITRNEFIHYFGNSNREKGDRYSWSGKCVPVFGIWNDNGQQLTITDTDDIYIYYSFEKDKRVIKDTFPSFLKKTIVIALWKKDKLKLNIERKFNKKGFFMCIKEDNTYKKICFGKPFTYEHFINGIRNKKIIFDSGMYEGNNRNYSQFRGSSFWNDLITEEYQ